MNTNLINIAKAESDLNFNHLQLMKQPGAARRPQRGRVGAK